MIDVARVDGASNILWVWSPGGAVDSLSFYPGARYVDYVGISVLEYTRWELEIAKAAEPRLLSTLIQEKYDLLAPLEKPMILAEIGIDLNPALKQDSNQGNDLRASQLPEDPGGRLLQRSESRERHVAGSTAMDTLDV